MFAHTNKLFMAIIALSALTYFERADYNLPLFAFILLLWNYPSPPQKTRLWYLMAVSAITDLIWIIYWAATWGSYNNREHGICTFTIVVSAIVLVVKIVTLILTFLNEAECKACITEFGGNIKSIFQAPTEYNRL